MVVTPKTAAVPGVAATVPGAVAAAPKVDLFPKAMAVVTGAVVIATKSLRRSKMLIYTVFFNTLTKYTLRRNVKYNNVLRKRIKCTLLCERNI